MIDEERLSNRAHDARVALRLARLRAEQGTDQAHLPVPPTPFLLGMTNAARHEQTGIYKVASEIVEKATVFTWKQRRQ